MSLLSGSMMSSLISSSLSLGTASAMNSQREIMTARSHQMETEIEIDKSRKLNTKKKEEGLEQYQERIDSTTEAVGSSLSDINEKIAEDGEKIRLEEEITNEQESKAEEARQTEKANPQDLVEISPEARAAQAASAQGQPSGLNSTSDSSQAAAAATAVEAVPKLDTAVSASAPKVHPPAVKAAKVSMPRMDIRA